MPPASIRRPVTVSVWLAPRRPVRRRSPPCCSGIGVLASALTGRRQPLIVARLTLAYFATSSPRCVAAARCGWPPGAGRLIGTVAFQLLHWRLLGWFFGGLAAAGRRRSRSTSTSELPRPRRYRALEADRPLIVLSRHAGPGDTIFIVDELISRYRPSPERCLQGEHRDRSVRRPPAHRLPQAMLDPADREACEAQIEELDRPARPAGNAAAVPRGRQLHGRAPSLRPAATVAQGPATVGRPRRADVPCAAASARGGTRGADARR